MIYLISLYYILAILPLLIIYWYPFNKVRLKNFAVFMLAYLMYELVRLKHFDEDYFKDIYKEVLRLIVVLTCYFVFIKNKRLDYVTLHHKKDSKKIAIITSSLILLLSPISFFFESSEWDLKSLVIISTFPGISEGLYFFGILLPVLLSENGTVQPESKPPKLILPVLIISILFALKHAISVNDLDQIQFNFLTFAWTFVPAVLWCIMTLRTGSILLAVVTHMLANFFIMLIVMLK